LSNIMAMRIIDIQRALTFISQCNPAARGII
jgi:hypothetical protein